MKHAREEWGGGGTVGGTLGVVTPWPVPGSRGPLAVRVGQGPGSGSLTDAAAFGLPQGQRKREAGPAPHL